MTVVLAILALVVFVLGVDMSRPIHPAPLRRGGRWLLAAGALLLSLAVGLAAGSDMRL